MMIVLGVLKLDRQGVESGDDLFLSFDVVLDDNG